MYIHELWHSRSKIISEHLLIHGHYQTTSHCTQPFRTSNSSIYLISFSFTSKWSCSSTILRFPTQYMSIIFKSLNDLRAFFNESSTTLSSEKKKSYFQLSIIVQIILSSNQIQGNCREMFTCTCLLSLVNVLFCLLLWEFTKSESLTTGS